MSAWFPLWLALSGGAEAATPTVLVSWTPFSRGDLAWIEDGRGTGTGVGEFDGLVAPALDVSAGVWFRREPGPWDVGLTLGLGVARIQTTTWIEDIYRTRHVGVVRPSLDLRVAPWKPGKYPWPWLLIGAQGDIPSARDASNGYTEEEQTAADDGALLDRARLGGIGARIGFGLEQRLVGGLTIGAQYTAGWHRGFLKAEDSRQVSSWVGSEVALVVGFHWGHWDVPPPSYEPEVAPPVPLPEPVPAPEHAPQAAPEPAPTLQAVPAPEAPPTPPAPTPAPPPR